MRYRWNRRYRFQGLKYILNAGRPLLNWVTETRLFNASPGDRKLGNLPYIYIGFSHISGIKVLTDSTGNPVFWSWKIIKKRWVSSFFYMQAEEVLLRRMQGAWWKLHPEAAQRKHICTEKCTYYKKQFEVKGSREQKSCSHNCYIKDRFWEMKMESLIEIC